MTKDCKLKKVIISSLLLSMAVHAKTNFKDVYFNIANGEFEQAISLLQKQNGKGQDFLATKFYLLGISQARLQDFDEAIKNFKIAIKYNSKAKDLYYELGQALYAMNELTQSRKAFIVSAKKRYKAPQAYYYVAHISQLLDDHKDAKNFFIKALKDKDASKDIQQVSRFQLAETLLTMARTRDDVKKYVERYVLPQMDKAYKSHEKGNASSDIKKRLKEVQREFGLDPDLLVNGEQLPKKKLGLSFTQSLSYDNNFTLTNDLPGNQQSLRDTFIFDTSFETTYQMVFKRRYLLTPSLQLTNAYHTDRSDSTVFSSDAYEIIPSFDSAFAHKMFNKAARFLFNFDYKYKAEDNLGEKSRRFNSRTFKYEFGEKLKYFSFGDTTFKYAFDYFRSYDDSLNYDKTSFSMDQLYVKGSSLFLFLYIYDSTDYYNEPANNTSSNLIRFDYIKPNFFAKTSLSTGVSQTWLSYEDLTKSEERGTETTSTFTFKLSREVGKHAVVDLSYNYTKNDSQLEDSKYSKHVTSFDFSLDY